MIGDVVECWASPSFTRHRCLAGSGLALCGVRAVFLSNPWPHHVARAKDCPVCLVRASRELSHREPPDPTECTCGRLALGLQVLETRNWEPSCPVHGTASAWWSSPEQVAKRDRRRAETLELQARAREARR